MATCAVNWNSLIRVAAALAPIVLSATAAQAQCASAGQVSTSPELGTWTAAVAGGSASVAALVSSINSVNTAFLTQSSAFIGSPPNPQPDEQGGGVWARGVGGHLDSATATTASNNYLNGSLSGNITCNTHIREDFAGVQAGADVARLNVNGWNLHVGLTTGYLGSDTHDATPQGLNPPPSFRNSLQIPFAGLYGAASYGGWLFDGQVRGDFYQNEVSDDNHGLMDQHFGARGFSVNGNVAYRQNLANQWFVEPSAGIIWSRTHVDPLNVPGTLVLGTGAIPPWVLTVNDIYSTLGRVSIRAGTTVRYGDAVLQPFASFGVFHELHGGATSSLTSSFLGYGGPETYSSTISTASLGTYAQLGAGVAAKIVDTGWVAYLRGDYRTGDNIEGWTLNGGIRYQFTPEPVRQQDTGLKEPLIGKTPVYKAAAGQAGYDWSGLYAGAWLGAGWGASNWNFPDEGAAIAPRFAGFLGGGDVGYNVQAGRWVYGLEGSAGPANAHGARACPAGFFYNCEAGFNWLSTATGRAGYNFDRLLTYVKAGAVIANGDARFVCNTNSRPTSVPLTGCPSQSDSKVLAGWTAGLGYEFGLSKNVSARGELMYFDLGSEEHNLAGLSSDMQRSGFISTLGLHHRFGG